MACFINVCCAKASQVALDAASAVRAARNACARLPLAAQAIACLAVRTIEEQNTLCLHNLRERKLQKRTKPWVVDTRMRSGFCSHPIMLQSATFCCGEHTQYSCADIVLLWQIGICLFGEFFKLFTMRKIDNPSVLYAYSYSSQTQYDNRQRQCPVPGQVCSPKVAHQSRSGVQQNVERNFVCRLQVANSASLPFAVH